MRLSPPIRARERAEALQSLARLSLTSESPESMDRVLALAHLSLTSVSRTGPETLDHPIAESLTRAAGSSVAKARVLLAFVRAVFEDRDTAARNSHRDLSWFGLTPPETREDRPAAALAFLSLTKPDHQSRVRSHGDRHDNISLVWAWSPEPPMLVQTVD